MNTARVDVPPGGAARALLLLSGVGYALGGLFAMLLRWTLGFPASGPSMATYGVLFTLHGTAMIFFALTPLLSGLSHALLPRWLGHPTMASSRAGWASFALTLVGLGGLLGGLALPLGGASTGWTAYPPLSLSAASPSAAQTLFSVALLCAGLGALVAAVNVLATLARGARTAVVPLAAWGFGLSSGLTVLFVPVLVAAQSLLIADRHLATRFFAASGDTLRYQHLFWIFGHPEVYALALPVWAMVSDLLAEHTGREALGRRAVIVSFCAVAALGSLVYGHHLFAVGLGPLAAKAFMTLTVAVSVPSSVVVLSWFATLWGASLRIDAALLYALGSIELFVLGGLTGIPLGAVTTDLYLHGTAFVVGHFHLVMASSLTLGLCAALHRWFPVLCGRALSERLGRWHATLTFALVHVVFVGMLGLGLAGVPRRVSELTWLPSLARYAPWNRLLSLAAFALGVAQLLLAWSVLDALRRSPKESR